MATAAAASTLSSMSCLVARPAAQYTRSVRPVVGLPALRAGKVRCAAEMEHKVGGPVAAAAAAASVAASVFAAISQPALALVDDRLSTEGTGLSLGVSNPLLIWILLGVFALIWALFFTYASGLKEEDDSGLAL